uniref:Uncharacterized protein n=1 Tax=Anopheles atroparvus TaxID=41427 RepID=A0A182J8L2_ANOAO
MIHLLHFLAEMNTKVQFHNHPTDPTLQLNSFIQVGEFEKDSESDSETFKKSATGEIKTMSVRALRNIFLQRTMGSGELVGTQTVQVTEDDAPIADYIKEHYEGSEWSEATSSGSTGGKSVKELKQLYEAKVKALSSSADRDVTPDHPFVCACSRPPTAGSDERQDIVSLDMPHPDGQHVFHEEPVESNPASRWYVASSKIQEVPNGLRLTMILMNRNGK